MSVLDQSDLLRDHIASILAEAGVLAVVNVVTTSNAGPVVSAMLRDPRVRLPSFTGSTEVRRAVLRESADQILKCAMELGGNGPLIVLDDTDFDVALDETMVAKMRNRGQACTAANRILVHRSIHDTFVERLAQRMEALVVGSGVDGTTQCGPLVDAKSVTTVAELVDSAVRRGARIVVGGQTPERAALYYEPIVLADVPTGAAISREEIFGPVAAIVPSTPTRR
ncbi:aldehyde dehydrogenase family protein [Rhodococcus sp. IEGM 1366]|nr:aldehyde dehydrogenase family protein [Rhodococcus sp. IEGM 1366]MDV8071037.1 aldehyde dehydrogenase family protein [Rhodococcus sp. IEGM 1366]